MKPLSVAYFVAALDTESDDPAYPASHSQKMHECTTRHRGLMQATAALAHRHLHRSACAQAAGIFTVKAKASVPVERVLHSILILRGQKVLLDSDLAVLYGVTTARLNQQVRRNIERFPEDFMFELTAPEFSALMLQSATSKPGRGGRRKLPLAFTEHGAIMAATLLNSSRAVEMSIYVVRAFVQLREMLSSNKDLAKRLDELEVSITRKLSTHDQAITGILKTIRELMQPPETNKRPIGFVWPEEKK
jgi:hypothetical protein